MACAGEVADNVEDGAALACIGVDVAAVLQVGGGKQLGQRSAGAAA